MTIREYIQVERMKKTMAKHFVGGRLIDDSELVEDDKVEIPARKFLTDAQLCEIIKNVDPFQGR